MSTVASVLQPIQITAGVQPPTDKTPLSTPHFTFADKIRFQNGVAQKIGGFRSVAFSNGAKIDGVARSLYSAVLDGVVKTLIGTNLELDYLTGQQLFNITPLETATHSIPNSLATDYVTLPVNPIVTTLGSAVLKVADASAAKYAVGDTFVLSGSTAVGGVPNTDINAIHVIRTIGAGFYTTRVATTATSTASGGGAAVVRATGLLTVTAAAHGQANGDRVAITGAADTGGILAAAINLEFPIRNVTTNTFDVMTAGIATSAVTAAGGAGTLYQKQITAGDLNQGSGQGYGLGKFGVGKFGVSKTSSLGITYPRIWFFDRFADTVLMTPGNQTGLYEWHGDPVTAPMLVLGAPAAINYMFVSNGIVVTFGAGGVLNRIFASDQNDPTQWTASSTNQVFEDDIEGAGQLVSHVPVAGVNLLFTGTQTYIFTYIGLPLVWSIQLLDNSIGIIGPMARCSVNNVAYWMSHNNFYRWNGGNVEIIPANSQDQSTCLAYVYNNINQAQASKCFAWYNDLFSEVWFHYPSANSNECDRLVRVNIIDNTWAPDTFNRSCAEYPDNLLYNPRMISPTGTLYVHETGTDADGAPLPWQLTSNLRTIGKKTGLLTGILPDSITSGNLSLRARSYLYPQSSSTVYDNSYTVASTAGQIPVQVGGRFWKYDWSGSQLGQAFIMGNWMEYVQESATN